MSQVKLKNSKVEMKKSKRITMRFIEDWDIYYNKT